METEPSSITISSVSIIIAARNEEANLPSLLASLQGLEVPKGIAVEFIFGNDQSTDATGAILQAWCLTHPNAQTIHIERQEAGLVGKANVLAQLCDRATGHYFLFTDADCAVPSTWVAAMMAGFKPLSLHQAGTTGQLGHRGAIGVVTGFSLPAGTSFLSQMQRADWFVAQATIFALAELGRPITAMGNNMATTKAAYLAAGGYRATKDSITEDFALFWLILRAGYGYSHVQTSSVLAHTEPMPNLQAWFTQRRRWLSGALQLPIYDQWPFWGQMAYLPIVIGLSLFLGSWQFFLVSAALKVGLQTIAFGLYARLRKLSGLSLPTLFIYEYWTTAMAYALVFSYLRQPNVVWKARSYARPNTA